MVMAVAATAAVLLCTAASLVLPAAYASCQSIEECKYVNLFGERKAKLFLPQETVVLTGGTHYILIAGTVPEGVSEVPVTIEIEAPDGTVATSAVRATTGGVFQLLHGIESTRHMAGIHAVYVSYITGEDTETNLKSGKFNAILQGQADHTVIILDGTSGCQKDDSCYIDGDLKVTAGQTVQWINESGQAHKIRAAAVGTAGGPISAVESSDTEGFFDTGIIPPGGDAILEFDGESMRGIYSCMFHPWMEATISVTKPAEKAVSITPDTVVDIKEDGESGTSVRGSVLFEGGTTYHTSGDRIEIDIIYAGFSTRGSQVSLLSPDGSKMTDRFVASEGKKSAWSMITQPTWEPGKYTLNVDPRGSVPRTQLALHIEQHESIRCEGIPAGNLTAHGPKNSPCYASTVGRVVDHDTLTIGGKKVTLEAVRITAGNATEKRNAMGTIAGICPEGGIAVVDAGHGIIPSRNSKTVTGAVYCGENPRTLNEQMMDAGIASLDMKACETTEFAWGRCPPPPVSPEEAAKDHDATNDENRGSGDNCMIALVTSGTPLAESVQLMREYRQEVASTVHGAALVDAVHAAYYVVSPAITEAIRGGYIPGEAAYAAVYVPVLIGGALAAR